MIKNIVLTFILIQSFCLNAQYHKAKLQMTNGSIKEGFAKLPSNRLLDNKVEFKTSRKGEVQKS